MTESVTSARTAPTTTSRSEGTTTSRTTPSSQPTPAPDGQRTTTATTETTPAGPQIRDPQTRADTRSRVANDPIAQQTRTRLQSGISPSLDQVGAGTHVMMRGHAGAPVREAQGLLNGAGANPPLNQDGIYGPATEGAVRDYQSRHGLTPDGRLGKDTLNSLRAPNASQIAQNPQFQGLPEETRNVVTGELNRHNTDPAARRTISDLATSPGFAGLSPQEQQRLARYVGGTNQQLSQTARSEMERTLRDPAFANGTPAEQTARLQGFLRDQPGLIGVTNGVNHNFDGQRRPYEISAPTEVTGHGFRSGNADATRYDVTIDGRTIPVYMPRTTDPAAGNHHTIEEVARGLAALPRANRDLIQQVQVNPGQNPDDAYWAQRYNDPNFRSYMTAGADGQVNIYPSSTPQGQRVIDNSIIHETGHILSRQQFGNDDDPRWGEWNRAMQADGLSASRYARNSQGEDFSETLTIYQQVRGTPQEAELRALMPERFAILDRLLGN